MGYRISPLAGVLALAAVVGLPAIATAQTTDDEAEVILIEIESIPDAFEAEYFGNSGDYFEATSIFTQGSDIIGTLFPDIEIAMDASDIHELYLEIMALQTSSDPILRTPDLANPFFTSVQLLPSAQTGQSLLGSELIYERVPAPTPAVVAPAPTPPVRALY